MSTWQSGRRIGRSDWTLWARHLLILIFPNHISKEKDGDAVQVRLLVEKDCNSEEAGGEEDEFG